MEPQLRLFLDANLLCIIEVLPNSSKIQSTMNRFWIEMMQNKYFILPGIYLTIYKSNSCSKSKMHVKYDVDNFFHNWMHDWIYVLFIQLFNIAIVTFWTSLALTKLYKTFKWESEWDAGARSHLVPPPAVFTLLNILRIIWWYPHLLTHHNTSFVTITQDVTPLEPVTNIQHGSGVTSQFLFRIL